MNQYTLQYLEKNLEEEYQIQENSTSRYTMYKALSVASIGIALLKIILSIIHQKQLLNILPQISLIPFLLILTLILKRKPQYSWLGLIIFNTSLMFYQYELDSTMDPYTAYLQGSNLMMTHCVVIFISDFKCSVIQVFILGVVRIGITGIKNQQFDLYQFSITLAASFFYLVALYRVEKTKRLQYLQRLKENQWDQVITKIIVKPFVIFQFDRIKFKFIHKLSGDCEKCNTGEGLINFLRQSQYRKKTLEQFIFNLTNKRSDRNQFTRTLLIQYEKQTMKIRFSSFYLTEHIFLIVFDDDSQKVKNIKEQCYNNYLINQKIFLHSVISTYNNISNAIKSRNLSFISKIQIQQLIIYLKTKNSNIRIYEIKIKLIRIYKVLQILNQLLNQKLKFQQNDRYLRISTIPHQFFLLLLESLSLFDSQEYIITYQLSLNKELILQIYGDQLKEQEISKIKFPFLIQSIETFKSNKQDSVLIIFNYKPQISFHRF